MSEIISVIIIDDEPSSIATLEKDLLQFPEMDVIATASSAERARKVILKYQPDLLFMDVEMPEMTGLELLQSIQEDLSDHTKVVFYTAYDKYLLDALRASAFDYLLKPYLPEDLHKLVERVRTSVSVPNAGVKQAVSRFLDNGNRIALQTITGLLLLRVEDIVLFSFNELGKVWQILLSNQEVHKLKTGQNAKNLLALNALLVQVNPSCIVNINYLYTVENKTLVCRLYPPFDGMEISASRRCYAKLKDMLEIL